MATEIATSHQARHAMFRTLWLRRKDGVTSAGYLLEEEKTMAFGRGIGDACFHNYVLDVTQTYRRSWRR